MRVSRSPAANSTNGGNPKVKTYYDYMLSYSPYDNVHAQSYPAMLVFTSLWDSQVQYYEPAKWVAKLRATKTDHHPLIFSIDMSAGHSGKSGRLQPYRDTALEYAFILDQLSVKQTSVVERAGPLIRNVRGRSVTIGEGRAPGQNTGKMGESDSNQSETDVR